MLYLSATSEELAIQAMRLRVTDLFRQPDCEALLNAVQRHLEDSTNPPAEGLAAILVGSSPTVKRTRDYLTKVAATDSNVLIMGETGTGKELAAQAVHKHSARAAAPFVAVNCAAIPDSLFESELFGYERGAFTGAHARHEGKLTQANGGTVFLDEIGDMSPYAQAKLLRAVEDRRVERLGGNGGINVDVGVVAATNQPLERMVADGRFRRDLYFRLGVTRITLPPLRERLEDLASLAAHFLKQLNRAMGRNLTRFAPDAAALLAQYEWPGNVREFRNLIEAVAVEKYTGEIASRDLPEWFTALVGASSAVPAERDRILNALESSRWNKSKAASRLRWSRMTLYRKMALHSISGGGAGIVEKIKNNQAKPDNRSACANSSTAN